MYRREERTNMITPAMREYYNRITRLYVEKYEKSHCSHWPDEEIRKVLYQHDEEHGTNLNAKYLDNCYEPMLSMMPKGDEIEVKIICRPCKLNGYAPPCNRAYPEADAQLTKHFLENMRAFAEEKED